MAGILLLTATTAAYAQCDRTVLITSSKTEHLGADSSVVRTVNETDTVEFDKTILKLKIHKPDRDLQLKGMVESYVCDWSSPFREGKTVLKILVTNDNGETGRFTITVSGKDGKIALVAEVEETGEKVRLLVDKFEEKI